LAFDQRHDLLMGKETRRGFGLWLLEKVCPDYLYEGIEGDLLEKFEEDRSRYGQRRASARLQWAAIRFINPSIILRNKFKNRFMMTNMLGNYLKLTFRNIARSRGYSFINIFGLALGIAACLLTVSYVRFELSYDDYHPDVERIYRVDQTFIWNVEGGVFGSTPLPLALKMADEYPEVEDVVRVNAPGGAMVRLENSDGSVTTFNEDNIYGADSNFFNVLGYRLREGNPRTALNGLNKLVISPEVARKFFGDEPALGKFLQVGDGRKLLEITGVTEPQPPNSHFRFDYLQSIYTNPAIKRFEWSWVWTQTVTYAKLRPGASAAALEEKMAQIGPTTIKPALLRMGIDYDSFLKGKGDWTFYLRPIRDIHLRSGNNRIGPVGDIMYAYTFAVVGIFVLIIAGINFINLSTARASKRAKEVGVKKTLGVMKSSLMTQFQAESIILTLLSTLIALILVEGLRIIIGRYIGIDMPFTMWQDPVLLWSLPLIPLVIGFLAGAYPAFYLTAFNPVQVLKGKMASGSPRSTLRNSLVVAQFSISIALLAVTIVVYTQINFMRNADLGFNKENVLIVQGVDRLGNQIESFRNEVAGFPGVTNATAAMCAPTGQSLEDVFEREGTDHKVSIAIVKIDEHYFDAMDFEIIAGRRFDLNRPSDIEGVILNEITVRLMGWTPEEAVGQKIYFPGGDGSRHEIIGVMKDFHFQSLRDAIAPLLFTPSRSSIWGDIRIMMVRYESQHLHDLMTRLEKRWNEILDDTPIDITFMDDDLKRQYLQEQRLGGLFGLFSGLSVLIAVIGLVGLVAYSAEVRRKEIGIRKVFGATTSSILVMMNSQYVKLIIIGVLIAVPGSWWIAQEWLNEFRYRAEIGPMTFIGAGAAQVVIALVSVAYLSARAASTNPASVLKEE
jgi:putative ABC transport system permease protein